MRCKGCDYPLWDIAARACPECGLPFRPGDYEFAINSVRFCCPHCHQSYYGTGQKGLLVPSRFHCVSCARLVDLDEMVVLPREGVPESVSIPDRMPWLERHRIGFWKGLGGTWVRALGAPSRLAESIPMRAPDGSGGATIGPAIVYAMIFTIPYILLGSSFLLIPMMLGAIAGAGGGGGASVVIAAATSIASVAIACVVMFFAWAVIAHTALRITGPTPAGVTGTFCALGYSSSVNFLSGIPCIGIFTIPIGMCWWAVVATLMAIRIQHATPLRAVFAFIVAPVLAVSVLGGGFGVLAYRTAPRFPAVMTTPATPPPGPTMPSPALKPHTLFALADRVAGASLSYRARVGVWPRTCVDLVREGDMVASHLIFSGSPSTARAGAMTLDELDLLLSDQLDRMADAVANEADHPSGISHAGQVYMFTKGLNGDQDLSNVWIAAAVDPQSDEMYVIFSDGSTRAVTLDQDSIDVQNAFREVANLPTLPPPDQWP